MRAETVLGEDVGHGGGDGCTLKKTSTSATGGNSPSGSVSRNVSAASTISSGSADNSSSGGGLDLNENIVVTNVRGPGDQSSSRDSNVSALPGISECDGNLHLDLPKVLTNEQKSMLKDMKVGGTSSPYRKACRELAGMKGTIAQYHLALRTREGQPKVLDRQLEDLKFLRDALTGLSQTEIFCDYYGSCEGTGAVGADDTGMPSSSQGNMGQSEGQLRNRRPGSAPAGGRQESASSARAGAASSPSGGGASGSSGGAGGNDDSSSNNSHSGRPSTSSGGTSGSRSTSWQTFYDTYSQISPMIRENKVARRILELLSVRYFD